MTTGLSSPRTPPYDRLARMSKTEALLAVYRTGCEGVIMINLCDFDASVDTVAIPPAGSSHVRPPTKAERDRAIARDVYREQRQ